MKKIALEEHFLAPGFEECWAATVVDLEDSLRAKLKGRLTDFGEQRLAAMAEAGIERSVLSLAGPGVQVEHDVARATRKAREANDFLAGEIGKWPARYSGFAHVAVQDPAGAADELQRCVRDLGFCGAMINGHTNGRYLDEAIFFPFWERAEELGVPIYLHPADPVAPYAALAGIKVLKRATWEWTVETATHALRLVFSGLFDRFPKATLILGHLGETLPFSLSRFDSRARLYGAKLAKRPSEYIRQNIAVTTSGMFSADPLHCTIHALGTNSVMFSADYPFESSAEAAAFMDGVSLDEKTRQRICHDNAVELLKL